MAIKIQVHDCGLAKEINAACPACGENVIRNDLPDPGTAHQMERSDAFMMAQTKINQVLLIRLMELEQIVAKMRCKDENKRAKTRYGKRKY